MIVLMVFALVAGIVTVLSPCILPVLPVVLASAFGSSRWRPLGIVVGLVVSFAFFTLALTTLVAQFNISADLLRLMAAAVIALFALVLLVPALQQRFELLSSRLAGVGGGETGEGGFGSGAVVGASLGLVWAPCAGPILAAVTTVVATNRISLEAVAVISSYSLGVGLPMLLIAYGGRRAVSRIRPLQRYTGTLQRAFAVVMLAFAASFFLGVDRTVQAALVQSVPDAYTNALTSLENQPGVRDALGGLRGNENAPVFQSSPSDAMAPSVAGATPPAAPSSVPQPSTAPVPAVPAPASELPVLGTAPELRGITGWVNSEPTTLAALRGKVVIVDFWTYSCINCVRTFPYMNDWYQKYKDSGLVILGVHTPEFEFEKSHDNVVQAVQQYGIKYPVAQDNDFDTWNAYNNMYWPAKYIVDARGRVRYIHFGEGQYEETEQVIRSLLAEAGMAAPVSTAPMPDYTVTGNSTPETYLGSSRQGHLASPEKYVVGKPQQFSAPSDLPGNSFAFEGGWTVDKEYAVAGQGSGLELRFYANNVYIVLTPGKGGEEADVLLDGKPLEESVAGADVHGGILTASEPKLYHLVDLRGSPGVHLLSLRFHRGGTRVYTFTFG